MSGISGEATCLRQTVELKGHLIDSLTLSKVIDRIQQMGGDYRLNDIHVGSLKKDISAVTLTLQAPNETLLKELLDMLTPYGVVPSEPANANTIVCTADGHAPADAYHITLPTHVHLDSGRTPVSKGGNWVLVVSNGQARMTPVADLRQGDLLVQGTHGLQW